MQFSGGIEARYGTGNTGHLSSANADGRPVVNIKRLGRQDNGLGFYPVDPITGAILVNGRTIVPGDSNYLKGALSLARDGGLLLAPSQMPAYGGEATLTELPLDPGQDYGLLLLRNNDPSDLSSSFADANPENMLSMQTFAAPDRGVIFGVEDLWPGLADHDFNDLTVTLSSSSFQLLSANNTAVA